MKRIILIDDEPPARQHIRESFPWASWGFDIVAEAANGEEALHKCKEIKPDIAIIDITMPVMDGLTLLQQLNRQHANIKSIIITAHRDFEYVQQALQYGALGYILKAPVNLEETKAVLDRVCMELERYDTQQGMQESHQSLIRNYQYPLRKKFFDNMLVGVISGETEIFNRGLPLNIHLKADCYLLLYCKVDNLPQFQQRYPHKDQLLIEFSMMEIVRETLNEIIPACFEIFPLSFGQFTVILTDYDKLNYNYNIFVNHIYSALREPMEKYLNVDLFITVSKPFGSANHIVPHFIEAENLLKHRFYFETARPVFAEGCRPIRNKDSDKTDGIFREFETVMHSFSNDNLYNWTEKLKQHTILYKLEPSHMLQKLDSLKDFFKNSPSIENLSWPDFRISISIFDALDSLRKYILEWRRMQSRLLCTRPEIVKSLQFIQLHLSAELTLDTIAEHVQLSPSYLGYLFKKEIGVSIVDFITEQRITLAKTLLSKGQYRNYELAEKVGFRSYPYFCTMFKKQTGMTPNEYKHMTKHAIVLNNNHDS